MVTASQSHERSYPMARERVSVIQGKKDSNVMVIAPHGPDDQYTIEMTEAFAKLLQCHAIINRGFKRTNKIDTINSKANCNNTDHCIHEPVVYEEFTKPIIKFTQDHKKRQLGKFNTTIDVTHCYLFYIHGMNHKTGYDIVLGYGKGLKSNRYTISPWRVQLFYDAMEFEGYKCALGKAGGMYSARSRENMTQLFRIDNWASTYVESMQIEFSGSLRFDARDAVITAIKIARSLQVIADAKRYNPKRPLYEEF